MSWEVVLEPCWNLFFRDILLLRTFSAALGNHLTCLALCLRAIAKIFIFSSPKRTHQVLKSFLCVCNVSSENRPDMRLLYNAVVLQAGLKRGLEKRPFQPAFPPCIPYWKHYGIDITPLTFCCCLCPLFHKALHIQPFMEAPKQHLSSLWKVTKEHCLQYLNYLCKGLHCCVENSVMAGNMSCVTSVNDLH